MSEPTDTERLREITEARQGHAAGYAKGREDAERLLEITKLDNQRLRIRLAELEKALREIGERAELARDDGNREVMSEALVDIQELVVSRETPE